MSTVQNSFPGDHLFLVHAGDTTLYFAHKDKRGRQHSYKWSYLRQVFRERIKQCPACSHPYELFPGLVLQDEEGKMWKVQLQAALVPAKPEEEDGKASI